MNLTTLIPIPKKINEGLEPSGNRVMLSLFGSPRQSFGRDCAPVTNPALKSRIVTRSVGRFRVSGLDAAVESLAAVMADIKRDQPDAYAALGTAGMLCARLVRGSNSAISNHSWGTAIDLTIGGKLDAPGNGKVQQGLALIAPIFNAHGWFWGATFGREDAMHFECSRALVTKFAGKRATPAAFIVLDLGDRGPRVVDLQKMLNARGAKLQADGVFGVGTRAALVAFQAANGLTPDGIAGKNTLAKLEGMKAA